MQAPHDTPLVLIMPIDDLKRAAFGLATGWQEDNGPVQLFFGANGVVGTLVLHHDDVVLVGAEDLGECGEHRWKGDVKGSRVACCSTQRRVRDTWEPRGSHHARRNEILELVFAGTIGVCNS